MTTQPTTPAFTIETPRKYRVTLESYNGGCKRVTVLAFSGHDAMILATKSNWIAVDVKEI